MRLLPAFLLLLLSFSLPAPAADSLSTDIERLLAAVEGSGCTFIRNGAGHDPAAAAAHMRKKYDYFHDRIRTAEDFIRLCGTRSETTGRPYLIRCGTAAPVPAADWLTRELGRHRQGNR
jgi:hypothetical protein